MAGYYPSTCDTIIPGHSCDPCSTREYGRIRSAAFIKHDFEFTDPEDAAEWIAGINSGDIIILPDTHGDLADPAPVVGPGYGDTVETLVGYDFAANVFDPDYNENCDFWDAIKNVRNYKFAYRTSSKTHISDVGVTIIPGAPVADDLNAEVVWKVQVKWRSQSLPCPFATPEGVFVCFITEE